MNAVEIEEAVSALAERPFDAAEFPYAFLEAFGNKEATIKRLRAGASNKSDLGGVLQVNHIHLKGAAPGEVHETLDALRASEATQNKRNKVRYILAADGDTFEAEDLETGETVACAFKAFPDHFGFFLTLAGITTVRQIRESSFDIRATGRLNKLYVELLKDNPEWATAARRPDMNHFMARLIFCFFAEDTDIFNGEGLFTATVSQMTERDSSNTHEVIGEIFRAMNTTTRHEGQPDDRHRKAAKIRSWADQFPYVNGGLFSGSLDVPKFSKIARSYLIHIGKLNWKRINPDIFGSMIQAVADDEERGALGMHYTSVPNILKVLNPLFLDDLHEKLEEAGSNKRKLQNLRKRMARIRVFDPACGSGNFLVIAYKQMREIERRIEVRIAGGADTVEALLDTVTWPGERTVIPLTNFRGIELRDFPAEIARLALIIAEYQCDVLYRGQKEALAEFLPLDAQNWIVCGNALRLDWLGVCPPTGTGVKLHADDLLSTPLDQTEIDFENEGGEVYICGNPPYSGYNKQGKAQKEDLEYVFQGLLKKWGNLDYVSAWFAKSARYMEQAQGGVALVATNSICQGSQVAVLWPLMAKSKLNIHFAYSPFSWANLAANNAGITVVIVGLTSQAYKAKIFDTEADGATTVRHVAEINGYLVPGPAIYVEKRLEPISDLSRMSFGNHPYYGAALIMTLAEAAELVAKHAGAEHLLRPIYGSTEIIKGLPRMCLWIRDDMLASAAEMPDVMRRLDAVRSVRKGKKEDGTAQSLADTPHRFRDRLEAKSSFIAVPQTTSENREFLPCALMDSRAIVTFKCYALYDAPVWNLAIVASRLHIAWIGAVCGRMRTDFSYSNTLGWNTFPVPPLTDKNKADLTRCAEDILLAREAHFPATIADLYDPDNMPADLREAHERNDEVLERIYIGRRFRNDTERLEKLFELYTKMTTGKSPGTKTKGRRQSETGDTNDGSTQQVD